MNGHPFRTLPATGAPLRVIVVGAGGMGRAWLGAVLASPDTELAGVVDLDSEAARSAADAVGAPGTPTGTDLAALAAETGAEAVIDVTSPAAHLPVTLRALDLGLPVLGEKPAAASVAEALRLAAAAERSGLLFMVSQSRRYNRQLFRFRELAGRLGDLGILTTEFFLAPRFGGFRDAMAHPLLLDMAIHPFDTARFLLDAEPVSVYCHGYNPAWSWYAGDAAATAVFEMTGGARYVYTGSWCSPGLETSWNGAWRLSGAHGTAVWDGDTPPRVDANGTPSAENSGTPDGAESIEGALAEFVHALRTGTVPRGEIHENVMSLAMVDSAVLSATEDRRVHVDEVLDAAHREAIATADDTEREILASWSSVRTALTRPCPTG
ncbi:Gfo/Idh/MocA family protein [Streptomyces jeddahensis]|uniref:4-carboxy-2-hydroxymuconate-6-semialdehyde dehydrogenase n=1 Tax=Streptomyces jeddahensis TaxID=1716141 RepID=A0A177HTE4_9ACTN|nr:Gfo/Idh/MocA family oxidoreductase [Streptomyces jeddahensis]OAH14252.1 4-carboxy-2-hydroxymuconate-6-semialdehyde dehydrogenase [Streptomyces jeddahensis]